MFLVLGGCHHEVATPTRIAVKDEVRSEKNPCHILEEKVRNPQLESIERYRALRGLEAINRKSSIALAREEAMSGFESGARKDLLLIHNALALLARAEKDGFRSAQQALDDLSKIKEAEPLVRLLRIDRKSTLKVSGRSGLATRK